MSIPGAIHCGGGKRKTRVTGFDWVVVKALLRPMAGSLRQESGLPAEALAKAGGGWWRLVEAAGVEPAS